MKNFIAKLQDIWAIDELRFRILFTLGLIAIYRLGSLVLLPGVDAKVLADLIGDSSSQGLLGLLNAFTGGSFFSATIFALGIMPYISASIIVQLLGFAIPYFQKLQKDGENGQRQLNQITRIITIVLTIVQGTFYLNYLKYSYGAAINPSIPATVFWLCNVIIITAGTIFCMWLGERITDKGIGNGISLLITVGIVNILPSTFLAEVNLRLSSGALIIFIAELAILVGIVALSIMMVQAVRKIQIQFAKHMVGRVELNNSGSDRDYLPIKLNAAGVMPIIFAQALMFIPGALASAMGSNAFSSLGDITSLAYNVTFFALVVIFTYVYTALIINPQQYADYLKNQNAFIPGVKSGNDTVEYIDEVTTRVTFPGSLFLGLIAILPGICLALGLVNSQQFAMFFGGTSLLILVAVVLDTLQQIESHLLMRKYDGLIEGGRIKGRNPEKEVSL